MLNGADLPRVQVAANAQHDRRSRLTLIALEEFALGQHKVDPCGRNPIDGLDRAGKLAFQRTQLVDVLNEAGGAECA